MLIEWLVVIAMITAFTVVASAEGERPARPNVVLLLTDDPAFPQPEDQGFDWTRSSRGSRNPMRPHRLTGFATGDPKDPYRLDPNGFPYHQNSEDALTFLHEYKDRPFFLYYATWLVHTPIHIRSEQLLDKYFKKLGVERPENPEV